MASSPSSSLQLPCDESMLNLWICGVHSCSFYDTAFSLYLLCKNVPCSESTAQTHPLQWCSSLSLSLDPSLPLLWMLKYERSIYVCVLYRIEERNYFVVKTCNREESNFVGI